MCGLVGVAGREPTQGVWPLAAMRDTMRHRGPDDEGEWWSADGRVGLAHRRLAIIDLTSAGHQPMTESTGHRHVVLNGEIYNYRELRQELESKGRMFRTESDTEVLLGAYSEWGTNCLPRLDGMFAFGLYDTGTRTLFLARDRAGEKPLFYSLRAGTLVFASELKALMAAPRFPRLLELDSFNWFLAYGYVPGDRCILRDTSKLPPAHALTYQLDTGALKRWRYWELPPAPTVRRSFQDLLAEFERRLEQAVRRQLVADVPLGVLLSGGLDSGLVTAMAARASGRAVKTFTIAFPGHREFDEGPAARRLSEHFGTTHTELVAEPATVSLLPTLAKQFDEPIADSSIVPSYLVTKLVREQATVALGGDGGDELFGGYPHYSFLCAQEPWRRLTPAPFRRAISRAAGHLPVGMRGRNHLIGLSRDPLSAINMFLDHKTRTELSVPKLDEEPEAHKAQMAAPGPSLVRRAMELDFRTTLSEAYLVKVDRASMLNSLEVRAPFLDHHLIEFAFGEVPDDYRATAKERKLLPRALAASLFPVGIDLQRKRGLSLPLGAWFDGPWGRFTEEVMSEADPSLFRQAAVARLLAGQRRGQNNVQRLFALTIFELWRREYRIAL